MALAPTLSAVETGDETELFLDVGNGLVEIPEITDFPSLPSGEQSTFETTHMKSGDYKEFKKNKRKEGASIDVVANYIVGGEGYETLKAAEAIRHGIPYKIVTPQDDEVLTITGFALVMNVKRSNPMNERRQLTFTMKWVAAPTEAVA